MSRHKTCYVISYHGILCHDMSYVTTIAASLLSGTVAMYIAISIVINYESASTYYPLLSSLNVPVDMVHPL